jgi:hypothetical protein
MDSAKRMSLLKYIVLVVIVSVICLVPRLPTYIITMPVRFLSFNILDFTLFRFLPSDPLNYQILTNLGGIILTLFFFFCLLLPTYYRVTIFGVKWWFFQITILLLLIFITVFYHHLIVNI